MQKPPPTPHGVRYETITRDQVGQRIDNFLLNQAKGVPRSHIYRIIRTGQVRVNRGRIRPTYKLALDDQVRIPPMVIEQSATITVPDALIERLERSILFENDQLLVLNKPAGVPVHAGSGVPYGVIEALRQSRRGSGTKPELAHRLDRATSGCLLVGKSQRSGRQLQHLFRTRTVRKFYSTLLVGRWPDKPVRVEKALRRFESSGGERRVVVDPQGKAAVSLLTTEAYLPGVDISAVNVEILTGRTHQIRVHAASEGHAVVGDTRYGGTDRNRQLKRAGFNRMYLHCARLLLDLQDLNLPDQELQEDQNILNHELPNQLDVTAPLDEDWRRLLNRHKNT